MERTERVVRVAIPTEHINADAAIVACIDPRWWNAFNGNGTGGVQALAAARNWKYVPLTIAGGVKVLASAEASDAAENESILSRIVQELGLHKPRILALTAHRDCGAYGYFSAFGNDADKETSRLHADLARAREVVEKRLEVERAKAKTEGRPDGHLYPAYEFYVFDAHGVEQITF